MIHYNVTMQHNEKTFERLAHMQYDLFCKGNQMARTIISGVALVAGVLNFQQWWGCLLLVYGSYMASSKYASANHTAHKLIKAIKDTGMEFPQSRYVFRDTAMEVITMPENTSLGDPLMYSEISGLGEDDDYFYIFRDERGGYMMPKKELGKQAESFRSFMEGKTGKYFDHQVAPIFKLLRKISSKKKSIRKS